MHCFIPSITPIHLVRRPNAIELRKEGCVAVTREMHSDVSATSIYKTEVERSTVLGGSAAILRLCICPHRSHARNARCGAADNGRNRICGKPGCGHSDFRFRDPCDKNANEPAH